MRRILLDNINPEYTLYEDTADAAPHRHAEVIHLTGDRRRWHMCGGSVEIERVKPLSSHFAIAGLVTRRTVDQVTAQGETSSRASAKEVALRALGE